MTQVWQWTAAQTATAVRNKDISATEVTQAHLDRMAEVNPKINAVVQQFPEEALSVAQKVDQAIARGVDPGPLCGVPVTIKVNVDQAGHATTNGLQLQETLIAEADSPVVSNMRKAGAVIIGRTNTPAFSMRWFTKNNLHGLTLNPRNKAVTPGGSSGGAAAAVAAGIGAIGHGTDIAGSIRYPAYACGLQGLRPTLGRVPAYNASAPDRLIGAQLMAVSGPIARSVADIELSLMAMSAPDLRDPWHVAAPLTGGEFPKRAALVTAPDGMPVDDEVKAALRLAADQLKDAGWTVDEVRGPPMRRAAETNACLWMADTQLAATAMIEKEGDVEAQFVFEQMSKDAGDVGQEELMSALQTRVGLMRAWDLFLQEYPVLICPVSGTLPFDQQQDVQSPEGFAALYEAQLTQRAVPTIGVPSLAVAMGETAGRPNGVQLVGPRYREDILLAAGAVIEAASGQPKAVDPNWG
jgi:amidase